ncbi:unnamed protein product [Linum trigynum]|uniref:Uncharacterized protein n=1 Tax=Linum trigynum TaxID=586398 RepID=A0AAV2CIJ9_9ROSI
MGRCPVRSPCGVVGPNGVGLGGDLDRQNQRVDRKLGPPRKSMAQIGLCGVTGYRGTLTTLLWSVAGRWLRVGTLG